MYIPNMLFIIYGVVLVLAGILSRMGKMGK